MSDMAMFVTTLGAIATLGGVLDALMRAEIGKVDGKIDALAALTDQRFTSLESSLRPIVDHLISRGLAVTGKEVAE